MQPVEQVGHPQLLHEGGAVVAGGSIHRQPHRHAKGQHLRHPGDTGGELHVADGTVGHAGTGAGQLPQLFIVEVDAVGKPHIRASPAQGRHELQRPDAVVGQHVMLLVLGLAQVGMEPDTVLPGQDGTLPQQLRTDGERGTGGQGHLAHGAGPGIMVGFNDPAESAMISSTVWTTLSGGRPPSFLERSMLPREANIRMPSSSAAANWAPSRSPAPAGKT